ncbi:hypothetical protein H072_4733 [Dactylellina haptotyla CBS 200.50]|uniref:Uncharacterized protein n=1 Tax=Dactylellina haptotyla (strain CBS 200.50) TaxID=1284197 RepID=S8C1D0_DACHA|nr:hypothetical protein H072_4733 [Dactylellina haptotyla CBS 200.50]
MESLLLTPRFTDSSILSGNATTPLPALPYCHPQNALLVFLSQQLQTCIPTPMTFFSTVCGILSITAWLFAQLPQIIKNYQIKSAESLSFMFILIWCLGDSSNLAGAVLLDQMTFQKVVAAYYVLVDVVLVFQWRWYARNHIGYTAIATEDARRPSEGAGGCLKEARAAGTATPPPSVASSGRKAPGNVFLTIAMFFNLARAAPTGVVSNTATVFFDDATLRNIGAILGWCSTVLYLSSRLPQIYLNHTRRSVSGLSPLLFAAAFCGNFFYSSSLLLNPSAWWDIEPFGQGGWVGEDGTTTAVWWRDTLPFLLGSAGVLAMDGYVGLQFWKWGGKDDEEDFLEPIVQVIVGVETEDGDDDEHEHTMDGKAVGVAAKKERSYFDEQSQLLAQMNGIYGTSAGSSSSSRG